MKFKYTKANGEISERSTILLRQPEPNYMMLDISEYSEEEQFELRAKYNELQEQIQAMTAEYYPEIAKLYETRLRCFKRERMSEVK